MISSAESLLCDLQGMGRFRSKAQDLHLYLADYAQLKYSEWVERVEDGLRDESSGLAMQLTGKLMEVDKADLSLQVNYSDRLICFLREVLHPLHRRLCTYAPLFSALLHYQCSVPAGAAACYSWI